MGSLRQVWNERQQKELPAKTPLEQTKDRMP